MGFRGPLKSKQLMIIHGELSARRIEALLISLHPGKWVSARRRKSFHSKEPKFDIYICAHIYILTLTLIRVILNNIYELPFQENRGPLNQSSPWEMGLCLTTL